MDFSTVSNSLGEIAGLVGSLTAIGGFLLFFYTKLIANPREKRKEEREERYQRQLREAITEQNAPIKELLSKHEERMDSHNERLIVLEVKNGVQREVTYVERYEGGERNGKPIE